MKSDNTFRYLSKAKQTYRDVVINLAYQLAELNQNKEYWTLCGDYTDKGNVSHNSEYAHITFQNLFKPENFHAIDNDPDIIKRNKLAFNNSVSKPKAHFYVGDFVEVITSHKNINPGLIHLDLTETWVNKATIDLGTLLQHFLNYTNISIIFNVMLSNPFKENIFSITKDEVIQRVAKMQHYLLKNSDIISALNHWNVYEHTYTYLGGLRSDALEEDSMGNGTLMGTMIFYKK
jgi:hypothetical protein